MSEIKMRFGLCCLFCEEKIKFSTAKVVTISKLSRDEALYKLSSLVINNVTSLKKAVTYCRDKSIGSFRITSDLAPIKTHPKYGYSLQELPDYDNIISVLTEVREFVINNNIRTVFHPDQFVILNSPKPEVIESSIQDLKYHLEFAELLNVDVINIHAGGVYGDKSTAIERLKKTLSELDENLLNKLTLENDDKSYTPEDLLPVCRTYNIPLVYDVHHHRCNKDNLSVQEATGEALKTWGNKEPLFHISSPKTGWESKNARMHHDYIDKKDFPDFWKNLKITVEIEAKAKELAIKKLKEDLNV